MSTKSRYEIECLSRLQDLTGQLEDVLDFLKIEGLISDNDLRAIKLSSDKAKEMHLLLKKLQGEKLQLLKYEWTILPVEHIALFILTDRNFKEFSYSA